MGFRVADELRARFLAEIADIERFHDICGRLQVIRKIGRTFYDRAPDASGHARW